MPTIRSPLLPAPTRFTALKSQFQSRVHGEHFKSCLANVADCLVLEVARYQLSYVSKEGINSPQVPCLMSSESKYTLRVLGIYVREGGKSEGHQLPSIAVVKHTLSAHIGKVRVTSHQTELFKTRREPGQMDILQGYAQYLTLPQSPAKP